LRYENVGSSMSAAREPPVVFLCKMLVLFTFVTAYRGG
jgi:hypothetical protein